MYIWHQLHNLTYRHARVNTIDLRIQAKESEYLYIYRYRFDPETEEIEESRILAVGQLSRMAMHQNICTNRQDHTCTTIYLREAMDSHLVMGNC